MKKTFLLALTAAVCCISCSRIQLQDEDIRISEGWFVKNLSEVTLSGEELSSKTSDNNWEKTGIPCALNNDSWWLTTSFDVPELKDDQHIHLELEGVGPKAEVWMNGTLIASAEEKDGVYGKALMDVTDIIKENNHLAIKVYGGSDEKMGIIGPVWLRYSNEVSLTNTQVLSETDMETFKKAQLTLNTTLTNHSDKEVEGKLCGKIERKKFSQKISLQPGETKTITLTSEDKRALNIKKPRIWWCNNLGNPEMYSMEISFVEDRKISDSETVDFGIRKIETLTDDNGNKELIINGKSLAIKGTAWTDDFLFNTCGEKLELEIAYIKDMNLNAIITDSRNEIPQNVTDLCNRKGIIILEGWDRVEFDPETGGSPLSDYNHNMTAIGEFRMSSSDFVADLESAYDHTPLYWSVKKNFRPQQLIYNPAENMVYIVNNEKEEIGLYVKMLTYDIDGRLVLKNRSYLDLKEGYTKYLFKVPAVKNKANFIFLSLEDENGNIVARNEYCIPAVGKIKEASVETSVSREDNKIEVKLENKSSVVAFFMEISLKDQTGELVAPAFWNDNLISLAPGETRTLTCETSDNLPAGSVISVSGWNVKEQNSAL